MPTSNVAPIFTHFIRSSRSRVVRTMRRFAEEELVIPEGRFRGTRWRADTQPFAGILLDEIDSGRWRRVATTGCVQSGKSLIGFVCPIMYHLFEVIEPVICGVPTVDEVGRNKWENEIRPAIAASRYVKYLPTEGSGARGGFAGEIRMKNGARLKFMSGAGGDEKRSSYTARVVVCTEVDKFDTSGAASREADPISQLEARTMSFPVSERRIYLECTVSLPEGRIWKEWQAGSAGRLVAPCPHCGSWVFVERKHLVGWEQALNALQAGRDGHFACPECGQALDASQRSDMNRGLRLIHRGQTIGDDGQVLGTMPETYTLGFRWNAFNNMFWGADELAAKEWQAREEDVGDDQEKWLLQFAWSEPWRPPEWDAAPLDFATVRARSCSHQKRWGKGQVPDDTEVLTAGVDLGKRFGHWQVKAWRPEGRSQTIDYGTFEVPSDTMSVERAITLALEQLRDDVFAEGWMAGNGDAWTPRQVLVDTGWEPDAVHAFLRQEACGAVWRGCLGRGESQHDKRLKGYRHPKKVGSDIVLIGEQYFVALDLERSAWRIEINVDEWKIWEFNRLQTPAGKPGAMEWYWSTNRNEHTTIAKHYTAEHPEETFEVGRGRVIKWHKDKRDNHYLDTGVYASVAGHLCGVRVAKETKSPATTPQTGVVGTVITTPDGRPYLATER